jgi:DNA-binding protein H-NS
MGEYVRTASLESIERQIEALRAKAEKIRARDKGPALRQIAALMDAHALTIADIVRLLPDQKYKRSAKGASGRKVKPMYRHPKTGETWSGRGRPARWLAALESAGHKRDSYLIKRSG